MVTELERFWAKVNLDGPIGLLGTPCWVWTEGTYGSGEYGRFYLQGGTRSISAHKYSYLLVSELPEGLVLDHLCRNTLCVNPEHLEAVTQQENVLRGIGITAMEALQTHCKWGHSLEDAFVKDGQRSCRQCRKNNNSKKTRPPAMRSGKMRLRGRQL